MTDMPIAGGVGSEWRIAHAGVALKNYVTGKIRGVLQYGLISSKEGTSPADRARQQVNPGPGMWQRIADRAINDPSVFPILSSFAAGGGVGWEFGLAAGVATGLAIYGTRAAVTAYRDYAYRHAMAYERASSPSYG